MIAFVPLALSYQMPAGRPAAPAHASGRASTTMIATLDSRKEWRQWRQMLKGYSSNNDLWPGASLRVSQVMTKVENLVTLDSEMCLREAATLLADAGITGAPVVEGGKLVGVISQTDLLYKLAGTSSLLLRGMGPRSLRYADNTARMSKIKGSTVACSCSRNPRTIAPSATIKEAAGAMLRNKHNRLMVAEDSKLVGILSSSDIVRLALCEDDFCDALAA